MLFKRKKAIYKEPELTKEIASDIYELLKTENMQSIRLNYGYRMEHIKAVKKEAKRIEAEMINKMSGKYPLTPPSFDEEGNVLTPAEYYIPTTQAHIKNSITSDLLDVATVVNDIRCWSDGDPDNAPSWKKYKQAFKDD